MFYTIYKITNRINGKYYIGSHKTKDLNDDYMGSGKYLKRAQNKHGIENFTKEILYVFDTPELMYVKEAEIVNKDFIAETNTYNIKEGGFGGFDYINQNGLNVKHVKGLPQDVSNAFGGHKGNSGNATYMIQANREYYANGGVGYTLGSTFKQSEKAIANQKKALERIGYQKGAKNSQYGTRWIYSLTEKKSKKISKESITSWVARG